MGGHDGTLEEPPEKESINLTAASAAKVHPVIETPPADHRKAMSAGGVSCFSFCLGCPHSGVPEFRYHPFVCRSLYPLLPAGIQHIE